MLKSNIYKAYFKNRSNIIILTFLIPAAAFGAYLRLKNLHILSFWWDDGQIYLGTLSTLKHGYPLLQSGNIMYHNILSIYIKVIPALLIGLNEVSLRLPSAIFGILMIPLIFLFAKEMYNKYVGIVAAIITSLNFWQIEFSREAKSYSEFQFFYLLSVFFFYLGFFKNKNKFKILALLAMFLTGLIQNQGFTLIFLFIPLLIYKGYKKFFKKEIVIPFIITASLIFLQVIHRILFWNVAITFLESHTQSSNPLVRLLSKFIVRIYPNTFYYKIIKDMFPGMYYVFTFGAILVFLYIFIKYIRNKEEDWKNIYVKNKIDFKLPFNLFFIYFIVFSNVYFTGIGPMENQQRYVFYFFPFIITGYSYILFDIARLITLAINKIKFKKSNYKKSKIINNLIYTLVPIIIFLLTINYINPAQSLKIPYRKNGDMVSSLFSPSSTAAKHFDFKSAGTYVYENKKEDDLVISTELLNTYPYTKQFDHWLWSATLKDWKPFDIKNDIYYDKYFGNTLIIDAYQLRNFLNENQNKNIWVITTASLYNKIHIDPGIKEFIFEKEDYMIYTGSDKTTRVYYFPKDETGKRFFTGTSDIKPATEEIIYFKPKEEKLLIDFTDPNNSKYLNHGWSETENIGTWSDSKESSLFIILSEKANYKMKMELRSLPSPDEDQTFKLYFNGELVANEVLYSPDSKTIDFIIPGEYVELDIPNRLILQFKYAKKPIDLGLGPDRRRLSVLFKYIEIEKLN